MYMLEHKKSLITLSLSLITALFLNSCTEDSSLKVEKKHKSLEKKQEIKDSATIFKSIGKNVDGAVIYSRENNKYAAYALNKQELTNFNHGRVPSIAEIKAWDVDIKPDGTGLPEGSGSVERGDELYEEQCAMCHGDFGAGGKGYPTLAGGQGTLKNQLLKAGDEPPTRTIGSYWPYASTLFWYIQTAMPFPNPKSLSNDEVYALTAYLLSINEISIDGVELDDEYVLNKEKFLKIVMPNVNGFYPVDPSRSDLKEQRVPLAQGERCMKDCIQPKPVHIAFELSGFDPAISTIKDLPEVKEEKSSSKAKELYTQSCSACHANKAIGAPVVGDKEAWAEVLEKGIEEVYSNSINGINAMPPKGGAVILDKEFKEVVDYMINASK